MVDQNTSDLVQQLEEDKRFEELGKIYALLASEEDGEEIPEDIESDAREYLEEAGYDPEDTGDIREYAEELFNELTEEYKIASLIM